ncbi:uncharacterized protein LOC127799226 isoform X2 [Diospyros lotus]|uniref:uncharacterized protein LOC127799226 isoform X2 n=1 Tax=Diospyros lotus TaxID=55363 RepID=UPI0022511705|nr:uncharacterized protein LOC127799226 isoform X2 [Diospyros lotus]
MDYSLAALKLLCVQLKSARQTPSQSAMTLAGVLFQRACLQGILVSTASHGHDGDGCFLLDDGTGIIELSLSGEFRNHRWDIGMYVMVVGVFVFRTGKIPLIKKIMGSSCGNKLIAKQCEGLVHNLLSNPHKVATCC